MRNRSVRALLIMLLALAGCEVIDAPSPDAAAPAAPTAVGTAPTQPIPAPEPTAALPAPVLFSRAMAARAIGEDAAAGADLSDLLQRYPDSSESRQARFFLAESFARRGRWASAAELLRPFVAEPTDDALRAPAIFWLARCAEEAGDHAAAAAAYQQYRDLGTPLEPYAAMRQAAQLDAVSQSAEAAAAYEHAARADIDRGARAGSFERAISLHLSLGVADDTLLGLYDELIALANDPAYRARILTEAASMAQQRGQIERALAWLRQVVADAPGEPKSAGAVSELLAYGDPSIDPATAGGVYFSAGRWGDAIAQLDLAIAQATDLESGVELRRLRGLALRGQGDFPAALAALADAGALSPNGEAGRQAQLDWIQTLGQSGDAERASQAYQEYAAAYPDDPRAPEALDRAAQLRERLGDAAGAMAIRLDLGKRYPQSDQAAEALHSAGLELFAAARYAEARDAWQILADTRAGEAQAQAAFWAGRAASAIGDEPAAADLFRVALEADPTSYYGARAAEELGDVAQGDTPLDAPLTDADWDALRAWVRAWPGQEAAPAPADLGVEGDGFVRRAALLAEVGLSAEARNEWMAAAARWGDDPPRLAELARLAHSQGVPYAALRVAARLYRLAPADSAPPPALERLLFPTPYPGLVAQQSAERDLDPRLLYALLRQESLFDPGATSWVGARGLGQVMPETGQGIAQNLGVIDFSLDDLYRPAVSVRFGAYYLATRIGDMEGSVQAALSAYNGGLGNAMRWAGGSSVADPDLFTEGVDFPETKGYIKSVYGFYAAYQRIYK
ncbi:transglycosylase SLT domain-containing protein [Oscillochloris sp. ZM17-4]|uniref:transglycosylase SLT domain-containing protein n=1 Tax=Oscillochloris sp. ZM17-4 TaxID=2866714 RepID=UPI001C72F2C3|nr:transglycosylase SLT domain-containing protein [Oscillochloris sp. ZM17-4]MBX0326087.1 transglycosylase SLT domain-containing protein [Oscillochloris sp. ZM17-4]